ncbi:MAG: diguanylate cyclase domain-containing protein [Legionellales bacterium]
MDNLFVLNETTLKRIPLFLVLIIILLLGLPYVGMSLGLDFSVFTNKLSYGNGFGSQIFESQIRGYLRQTLLQWSGFSLAAVAVLLSFTQYRLSNDNDKIALIIGLTVLFSGSVEALHILAIDGLTLNTNEKNNLDAFVWVFSNAMSGLILIVGLLILLTRKDKRGLSFFTYISLIIFFVLTAITLIFYATVIIQLPDMWIKNAILSRPYELISIGVYLVLIVFIYPRAYKAYPTILTDCIFYMSVTQIVISMYLMLLSNAPYDSAYNIAYFLKVVTYLIPCSGMLINYTYSYSEVLIAQKKLKLKQNELQYIASHDSLTNLFNRRQFEDLLDRFITNAARDDDLLGLLLLDVDDFKTINDTFGHSHGDELLKQFSQRLVALVRKGDFLSRVGGDEFTLIMPKIKSTSAASLVAERILNELNNPYSISGKLLTVTVSIGISIYPTDGDTTEKLLRKADLAMYKAKNGGKNTYQIYGCASGRVGKTTR